MEWTWGMQFDWISVIMTQENIYISGACAGRAKDSSRLSLWSCLLVCLGAMMLYVLFGSVFVAPFFAVC